jgi:hypothetical protein
VSGLFELPESPEMTLASMVISFTLPSRPHNKRRSSSSFASRQSSTMRGICTTLSAPGRRVSNGSFYRTFRMARLQRTFPCVQLKKAAEVARLRTVMKAELAASLQAPYLTGTPSSGAQSPNDFERKYAFKIICGRSQRARFVPKRERLR